MAEESTVSQVPDATPMYKQIAQETLEKAKHMIAENKGWKETFKREGRTGQSKHFEGVAVHCFRSFGMINGINPKELLDMLWSFRHEEWNYDGTLMKWDIVEDIDPSTRIIYQEPDGTCCLVFKSIKKDDFEGSPKEYVRANVIISAFLFQPCGVNDTKAYRLFHLDPVGALPTVVVNSTAKGLYTFTDVLKDNYETWKASSPDA